MVGEVKIHRATIGEQNLQMFYIEQGKIKFTLQHITMGWKGHHWKLWKNIDIWYPSDSSSPLEVLVISGHGMEKILREGRLMVDGEGRWMI